jgi:HK97 family phage prohead protease
VIETDDDLDTQEVADLAQNWIAAHGGVNKAHLPAVLTGGAKFSPISINPRDSQFLESRQYSASTISGMVFRVPPHMIGIVDRTTSWGKGIEQQERGFVTNTLGGYIGRLEEAIDALHPGDEYCRLNLSQRLRGDKLTRSQAHALDLAAGWISLDEVRAEEDMAPIPDGLGRRTTSRRSTRSCSPRRPSPSRTPKPPRRPTQRARQEVPMPEKRPQAQSLDWRRQKAATLAKTNEHRALDVASSRMEVREADDGTMTLAGYASIYDRPYDMGWFTESIARGAGRRSLGENPDVQLLVNHTGLPLARTLSGTLRLSEDETGLYVEADLDPDDPDAQSLVRKMRRGDIDQMSFAFRVTDDTWDESMSERTIRSYSIHRGDVSVVNMGANDATHASVRRGGGDGAAHAHARRDARRLPRDARRQDALRGDRRDPHAGPEPRQRRRGRRGGRARGARRPHQPRIRRRRGHRGAIHHEREGPVRGDPRRRPRTRPGRAASRDHHARRRSQAPRADPRRLDRGRLTP